MKRNHISVSNETIAARAYNLWEIDGKSEGRDVEYWLRAEQELLARPESRPVLSGPRKQDRIRVKRKKLGGA